MAAVRFARLFLFGFAAAAIVWAAVLGSLPYLVSGAKLESGRWLSDALGRKSRLALQTPGGRVLILAGSNALYGLSARRLEEQHGVRALNLAAHAGLGRKYLLHYGAILVKPGDIVVLPLEYELWQTEKQYNAQAGHVLANDLPYLESLPLAERARFLASVRVSNWARLIIEKLSPADVARHVDTYQADSLNAWGDESMNTRERVSPAHLASVRNAAPLRFALDRAAAGDIAAFARAVARKGATLVVAYPSTYVKFLAWEQNGAALEELERTLKQHGIRIVGHPTRSTFDLDCAFDTVYHQIVDCQLQSTDKLAALLREHGLLGAAAPGSAASPP